MAKVEQDAVDRIFDILWPLQEWDGWEGPCRAAAEAVVLAFDEHMATVRRAALEEAAWVADAVESDFQENVETSQQHGFDVAQSLIVTAMRALIDQPAADGWQTIDSAPENRAILVHVPHDDYHGNNGCYAAMLVNMGTGRRWMTFGRSIGRDLGAGSEPTHWRPLPAPPALIQDAPESLGEGA